MTKIDKSDAIEKYKILLDHISHLDSISYKYRFFAATVFGGFVASVWLVVTSLGMKDASIILFSIISLFTIGCIITISLTDFLNQEYKEASIRNCERLEKFTVEELHTGIFFNRFSSLQRSVTPLTTNLALIVFYAFPIFCIYIAMFVVWVSIEGIYFHGIFEHLVRALCDRSVDLQVRNACVENHGLTVLSSDTIFFVFIIFSSVNFFYIIFLIFSAHRAFHHTAYMMGRRRLSMKRVNFFKFFDRLHTLADRRDVFIKIRKKTFESIKRRVLRSLIFLYFIFVISSKDIKFIINSYLQDDNLLLSWPFGIDALLFPLLTFTALLFLIHLITFILEPFTGLECARRLNRMTNGAFGELLSQR